MSKDNPTDQDVDDAFEAVREAAREDYRDAIKLHSSRWALPPTVRFQRLPHGDGLPVPGYQSALAAGMDLPAAEDAYIPPGKIAVVSCGFNVAISEGYEGNVRPRSGLARKYGISIVNSPGTIDADYRGEICCILINHGDVPFTIKRGDRIAQMVVSPVARAEVSEVKTLDETERGAGGFGSTGVK